MPNGKSFLTTKILATFFLMAGTMTSAQALPMNPFCYGMSDRTGIRWSDEVSFGPGGIHLLSRVEIPGNQPQVRTQIVQPRNGLLDMPSPASKIVVSMRWGSQDVFPAECRELPGTPPDQGCFSENVTCTYGNPFKATPMTPKASRSPARIRCEGSDMYADMGWVDEVYVDAQGNPTILYSENGQGVSRVFSFPYRGKIALGLPATYRVLAVLDIHTNKVEFYDPKTLKPTRVMFDDFSCVTQ